MSKDEASGASNYQVRALDRALDILDAFSLAEPELTLTAIAARVNLAKSTATRLLSVLEERGWLERSTDTDRYRVGVRAFELGTIYIQTTSLEAEAEPYLQHLARTCHQTANLGILNDGEVVHIAVVAPERPIRFSTPLGQRESAHCTGLGKALLAELSPDELRAVIARHGLPARTARTITTQRDLQAELVRVRAQGYAMDDEEAYTSLRCVAAPVRDARGRVIAALSVSGLANEFTEESLPRFIAELHEAAQGLSVRLGNGVHEAAKG